MDLALLELGTHRAQLRVRHRRGLRAVRVPLQGEMDEHVTPVSERRDDGGAEREPVGVDCARVVEQALRRGGALQRQVVDVPAQREPVLVRRGLQPEREPQDAAAHDGPAEPAVREGHVRVEHEVACADFAYSAGNTVSCSPSTMMGGIRVDSAVVQSR
ncbi:hypothetical protein KL943_000886 [Ogataea angusta]|nr:hypothetical protein KL943_000886 [Ogataea angusta]